MTIPETRVVVLILALSMAFSSRIALSACVDDGAGTYTCSGTSVNNGVQTGKTILDNSAGPVVFTNSATDPGAADNMVTNNPYVANTGPISVMSITGGIDPVIINSHSYMEMARGFYTLSDPANPYSNKIFNSLNPTAVNFSQTPGGMLLNNGVSAGLDSLISADVGTSVLTINNSSFMNTRGNLSSVITANNPQLTINNMGSGIISNLSATEDFDYLHWHDKGYWAITSYGGATYTAPTILDGTQSATLISAGLTEINTAGRIYGTVFVVDKNPILALAQSRDPTLTLTYDATSVGPRNSVINVISDSNGTGEIDSIYLGSGAHVVNISKGTVVGEIHVDQSATEIVDVNGGVASPLYKVAGDRTFTLNSFGQAPGGIVINDVVGAVNIMNINDNPDGLINIQTNGLGINILNLGCNTSLKNPCSTGGIWTGLSSLSFLGSNWEISEGSNISLSTGNVNIDSGSFQLQGQLSADNIIISKDTMLYGHLDFETALTPPASNDSIGSLTGHLVNNGHILLRNAELTVKGDADFNPGSLLSVRITPDGNGKVNVVGGIGNFSDGATIDLSYRNKFFRTGDSFTVATNSNGSPILHTSSGIVNFTSNDDGNDLILIANVAIPQALNPTVAGNNAVMSLMNYTGNNVAITGLQVQIQALSDEELQRTTERLRPEISDSSLRMLMQHTDSVLGLVDTHLFETHLADIKGEPRMPVNGEMPMGAGIWFQGIGASGTQDKRSNVDGYKLSSTGMAAGMDRLIGDADDSLRVGFAGAYAYGNIDNSDLTDNNRSNVNSYLGAVYASWAPDVWYLNGTIGLARHTFDTHRVALGYGNDSNHAAWQIMSKVDAGWPVSYNDLLTFVPQASFSYSHIDEEGYSETGSQSYNSGTVRAGVLGTNTITSPTLLNLNSKSYDSYRAGIGGKVLLSLQEKDYNAGLELRAHFMHELGDLANNSNARFVAGGVGFYSPGMKPDRNAILLGSSIRLTGNDDNDQLTLLANYDADIRDKYFGQIFSMMLRYDFDQGPSYLKKSETRKALAASRQQAAEVSVKATEKDVQAISQAIMPNTISQQIKEELNSTDPEIRKNAQQQQAVMASIDLWIQAIINNNLQTYLNSYSADFVSEEGVSRRQWENKRRLEMKTAGKPNLRIADLQVKTQGGRAAAVFAQTLEVESRREIVQKIVELEERNGRWLIVSEDTVPFR